jgi:hypothetical protein
MSYLVNKTDGELLATILDGQTNGSASSIVLIGKQVTGYGEVQNENFVHIMENFANTIDPAHPLAGQLWWNTATKTMQVFDGTNWRPVTGFTSSLTAPANSYIGDQWWDKTNDQYKIFNGTDWVLVGPSYSKLDGKSGALVETVYDTGLTKHTVIKVYHNGNVTAIINRDAEFTPNVAISGFTTVQPGISFTSAVDAIKLYGTATNSDTLGNLTPSQFLRSDMDSTTTGTLSVNGQLNVGQNNEFNASVNGLSQVVLKNTANNQDLEIKVTVANALTSALVVSGTNGLVYVAAAPVDALGVATKGYVDSINAEIRVDTTNAIASNVAVLDAEIVSLRANAVVTNTTLNNVRVFKANVASPAFTGNVTAPTPTSGDVSNKVATTAFVATAIDIFDPTKIYNGTTNVKANNSSIDLVAAGITSATVTSNGIVTATRPQNDNDTFAATTEYADRGDKNFVLNSVKYQPTCYVSDQVPSNSIGTDGDLWFQYQ